METTENQSRLNPQAPEFKPSSHTDDDRQKLIRNHPNQLLTTSNYIPIAYYCDQYLCSYPPNYTINPNPSCCISTDHQLQPQNNSSVPSINVTRPPRRRFRDNDKSSSGATRSGSGGYYKNSFSKRNGHDQYTHGGFSTVSEGFHRRRNQNDHENVNRMKQYWRVKSACDDGVDVNRSNYSDDHQYQNKQIHERKDDNGSCCFRIAGNNLKPKHTVITVKPDDQYTTVMIRNIPNRYTREMLTEFLDNHCMEENQKANVHDDGSIIDEKISAFDVLYLPIDFDKNANKGYAFVNFTNPSAVWRFYNVARNRTWNYFCSNKICEVAVAKVQGKEELIRHFEKSKFECESDAYLPVCFSPPRNGSKENVEQKLLGRHINKLAKSN